MTDIEWGPAIAVDGKRPGFVADGVQPIMLHNQMGWHHWNAKRVDPAKVGWAHPSGGVNVDQIKLPAVHPHYRQTEAAPIDWSGELEAVHEDGRVVAVERLKGLGEYCVKPDLGGGWFAFNQDGGHHHRSCRWRIRNVTPQPTPQADTKPDVTAQELAVDLARVVAEWPEQMFVYQDTLTRMNEARQKARAIVALLPEPVDPLIDKVAKGISDELWDAMGDNREHVDNHYRSYFQAAARRALALAGEKEA